MMFIKKKKIIDFGMLNHDFLKKNVGLRGK